MKLSRILSFLLLLVLTLAPLSADARHKGGVQKANTTRLVGVAVAGLNISYAPGQYIVPCPATTGIDPECQHYHDENFSTLRLAIGWEYIQPTLGGALDTAYLGYITNFIRQANLLNMRVIVDVHNFGGYNGIQINAPGGPTSAQFADLWSRLSLALAGTADYEIMNEPANMPNNQAWPLAAQAAITAVRVNDTTAKIYVDGDAYASAFGWLGNCSVCGGAPIGGWAPGGNDQLRNLVDPNNNLVFTFHAYADYDGSGSYPKYPNSVAVAAGCTSDQTDYQCAQHMKDQLQVPPATLDTNILVTRVTPAVNWCLQYNLQCADTESGVPYDDQNWLTALDKELLLFQKSNILFTYWGAGPVFGCASPTSCSYNLGVYPSGLGTGTIINTPQQAVLDKYTNAYQTGNYTLQGPNRGTVNVASAPFVINYNAYLKTPITITPSGGAGVTCSPSTVTLAAGFNGSGSYTCTATGTSTYVMSETNTGGITDPLPFGYATASDLYLTSGANPVNILQFRRVYAPFIGPVVKLRLATDLTGSAELTFSFTSLAMGAGLPLSTISTWANGQNIYLDTLYGQDPTGYNAGQITPDGSGPTVSLANQPQFIPYCQNNEPCLYFNGSNYLDVTSPLGNADGSPQTQQTVMAVFSPGVLQAVPSQLSNPATANLFNGPLINWQWYGSFVQNFWCNTANNCGGGWGNSYASIINGDSSAARTYSVDAQWHATAATYIGNTSDGSRTFLDGQITDRAPTSAPVSFVGSIAWVSNQGILTVTAVSGCPLHSAQVLTYSGSPANLALTGQASNAEPSTCGNGGGTGTYVLDNTGPITIASSTMTATTAFNLPYGRSVANIGYVRAFSPSATFKGYFGGTSVLRNQISNASVVAFQNDDDRFYGISSYAGWTPYAPTLNQSTTQANTLPWLGVNNFGWNFAPTAGAAPASYFAGLGANIERMVASWHSMQPTIGGALDATYMAMLDSNVAYLNNVGIDALIDNHDGAGYNGCGIDYPTCPTGDQFATYWGLVATHYLSNPKVAFDLANEPVGYNGNITAWGLVVQKAITAIRNTGATQYIYVELNNGYASCTNGGATGTNQPGTVFLSLTDPLNKLVYECHSYFDGNFNGQFGNGGYNTSSAYPGASGIALSDLQALTTWAVANNVKLFWGEFGPSWTQAMTFEMKVALDLEAANQATNSTGGWAGFSAWGGGYGWGNGYFFYSQPTVLDANTVDKPLDHFLNYYFTGHTVPCNVYVSGSSGPCSTSNWPYGVKFPI